METNYDLGDNGNSNRIINSRAHVDDTMREQGLSLAEAKTQG